MSKMWQRLRAARQRARKTQARVAYALGIQPPSVTMWERPDNDKGSKQTRPDPDYLSPLAKLFGIPVGVLLDDEVEVVDLGGGRYAFAKDPTSNLPCDIACSLVDGHQEDGEGTRSRFVPLLPWAAVAGNHGAAGDTASDGNQSVYSQRPVSGRAFALRVTGESMCSPLGQPSFCEGDIVVVDPDVLPAHRSFVVARLPGVDQLIFRQFIFEDGSAYLKALNPHWPKPIMELPDDASIVGTAVRVERGEDLS